MLMVNLWFLFLLLSTNSKTSHPNSCPQPKGSNACWHQGLQQVFWTLTGTNGYTPEVSYSTSVWLSALSTEALVRLVLDKWFAAGGLGLGLGLESQHKVQNPRQEAVREINRNQINPYWIKEVSIKAWGQSLTVNQPSLHLISDFLCSLGIFVRKNNNIPLQLLLQLNKYYSH